MVTALALSFAVIFVAELGDKSQLMAMTFALRYRWWVVLTAILTATTLVHAASVFLGHFLGLSIPTELMSIVGGLSMLVFGLWTVRGDELDDDEASRAGRVGRSVFFAVMSAFLLAELGDKTMLATIALAADHDWLGVWIGSTIGMVAADALAIIVGRTLGRHLPERTIALGAAVLFFGFAVWLIAEGLAGASAPVAAVTIVGALVITAVGVFWIIATNRRRAAEAAAHAETDTASDDVTQIAK